MLGWGQKYIKMRLPRMDSTQGHFTHSHPVKVSTTLTQPSDQHLPNYQLSTSTSTSSSTSSYNKRRKPETLKMRTSSVTIPLAIVATISVAAPLAAPVLDVEAKGPKQCGPGELAIPNMPCIPLACTYICIPWGGNPKGN